MNSNPVEDAVLYPIYEQLLRDLNVPVDGGRVLDVGAGSGRWVRFFTRRFTPARLVGVDFTRASVDLLAPLLRPAERLHLLPGGGLHRAGPGPGGAVRPDQRDERAVPHPRAGPLRRRPGQPRPAPGARRAGGHDGVHAPADDADQLDAGAQPLRVRVGRRRRGAAGHGGSGVVLLQQRPDGPGRPRRRPRQQFNAVRAR